MMIEDSTVFVIDDDVEMRAAIGGLLQVAGLRAESFATGREFLERRSADGPSCLVSRCAAARREWPGIPTEVNGSRNRNPYCFHYGSWRHPMTVKAMKSGAIEFFPKPFHDDDLLSAIPVALERDRARRRRRSETTDLRKRYETLTPREREVMQLVAARMLNKQTAFELDASVITIKAHRGHMMRKMKAGALS